MHVQYHSSDHVMQALRHVVLQYHSSDIMHACMFNVIQVTMYACVHHAWGIGEKINELKEH